jgi:hypothetical protein
MDGMSNIPINMTIDRRRTGQARIQGKAGSNFHGVNVSKGPTPGDAYIQGEQNGQTTTLRINSAFSDNGHGVFGRIAGVPFKGNWAQEPTQGDAELFLENAGSLTIDVNPETGVTESQGTAIRSTAQIVNAEGDEELSLLADGQRINMKIDRKEGGSMEIRGRSGDGPFRVTIDRRGDQGDLRIKGTIPESLSLLPVMWELYGDDSVEKPEKPLSMGAVATMSAFWHSKIS